MGLGYEASDLSSTKQLFRQNDIDAEGLRVTGTDADLEKFGVTFGHRKRLLKAIASLNPHGASGDANGSSRPTPEKGRC